MVDAIKRDLRANLKKHFDSMESICWIGKIILQNNHYSTSIGQPDIGGIVNYLPQQKLF
ncbi:hypothetical protein LINPERHAP1_LOCUS8660 [Linum perenne]